MSKAKERAALVERMAKVLCLQWNRIPRPDQKGHDDCPHCTCTAMETWGEEAELVVAAITETHRIVPMEMPIKRACELCSSIDGEFQCAEPNKGCFAILSINAALVAGDIGKG